MRLGVAAALVDGRFVPGDVSCEDGVVTAVGLAAAGRGLAVPGLVDLQVNGFAGVDFLAADAAGYAAAGEALLESGVTSYLPTFVSSPEHVTLEALRAVPSRSVGPRVLGVHLEGPFLSPARLGVHPASARRDPDPVLLGRLLDAGHVRLVTLAPELPGALELVDLLRARGVCVSLGHTDGTAADAHAAFDRGARSVTHVFNAMRPLAPRDPGVVGAALVRPDVAIQAIVDLVHLHPDVVRLLWSVAAGRLALVSDAIAGTGLGDGSTTLGDTEVTIAGGVARRADGVLAGSVLTLLTAVRNLVELGAPLAAALDAATVVPARILGDASIGRIAPGSPADVLVLDDGLELERVLVGGTTRVAG